MADSRETSHKDSVVSVCNAINAIRGQLDRNKDYISKSEARTRVFLVDVLLRSLGWEVQDPERVLLEHRDKGNRIDYVLVDEEKQHLAVVEAKRFGESLVDRSRVQATGYAAALGVRYVILTNGSRWEGWEFVPRISTRETVLVGININSGEVEKVAEVLMCLHRLRLGR